MLKWGSKKNPTNPHRNGLSLRGGGGGLSKTKTIKLKIVLICITKVTNF